MGKTSNLVKTKAICLADVKSLAKSNPSIVIPAIEDINSIRPLHRILQVCDKDTMKGFWCLVTQEKGKGSNNHYFICSPCASQPNSKISLSDIGINSGDLIKVYPHQIISIYFNNLDEEEFLSAQSPEKLNYHALPITINIKNNTDKTVNHLELFYPKKYKQTDYFDDKGNLTIDGVTISMNTKGWAYTSFLRLIETEKYTHKNEIGTVVKTLIDVNNCDIKDLNVALRAYREDFPDRWSSKEEVYLNLKMKKIIEFLPSTKRQTFYSLSHFILHENVAMYISEIPPHAEIQVHLYTTISDGKRYRYNDEIWKDCYYLRNEDKSGIKELKSNGAIATKAKSEKTKTATQK